MIRALAVAAATLLAGAGCSSGSTTHDQSGAQGSSSQSSSSQGSSSSGKPPPPMPVTLTGDLDLEIRDKAHVELVVTGTDVAASVTLTNGFGVAPQGKKMQGDGHVEAFPEADATLYTGRFDVAASASGPCPGQAMTWWLSLHRQGKNDHVGGSFTGYCGAGTSHGVPARILRFAGKLPLPM